MAELKAWKRILRRINKTLWLEKRKRNQEAVTALIWEALDFARRRQWHPTPVLLPGKSHGRRSLVGCSPCGREESDTTERLHFHFSLSCIGEGNGNPLQCSCLENPRDGGARPYRLCTNRLCMCPYRVGHDWSNLAAAAAAKGFWLKMVDWTHVFDLLLLSTFH